MLGSEFPKRLAQPFHLGLCGLSFGFDSLRRGSAFVGGCTHLCAVGAHKVPRDPKAFRCLLMGSGLLSVLSDSLRFVGRLPVAG